MTGRAVEPSSTTTCILWEQLSFLWSNPIDLVKSLAIRVERREEASKAEKEFPLAGNLMLCSMILARMQVPSASLVSTILCCFLSLTIWTVAVVGLHHLKSTPHDTASDFWGPPKEDASSSQFRLDWSTEDNYHSSRNFCEGSSFADIRQDLDYNFHKPYNCQRQRFQDNLIESMLLGSTCRPRKNWIVFTAGVMGAGKSYTMKQLHEKGRFPLEDFVTVDPDSVRRHLPEFEQYVQHVPQRAGELTRKESGMISEILTEAALRRRQNVLVDGTLRNSTWYQAYFKDLRVRYPHLQIGILHVTAPRKAVLERAMSRAKVTGRVVPRDLLERTMLEVPKSIQILSQKVDFCVELRNPPADGSELEIANPGITWDSFQRNWTPSCGASNIEEKERMVLSAA